MPGLLQLNVTANWGSTGRIAEGIGLAAMSRGWDSVIAYGRMMLPSQSKLMKVGGKCDVYAHYARHRMFDMEGLGSARATRRFIEQIKDYAPDIIHLHNIHDHWLNYPLLFRFLAEIKTPVVWTFHDCWPFTGGCAHFVYSDCRQWMSHCERCPFNKWKFRREKKNHVDHISIFGSLGKRINIVSVSAWLDEMVGLSLLGNLAHSYIYNGIDTSLFKYSESHGLRERYNIGERKIILGVSNVWSRQKGLSDFIRLSHILDNDMVIVLIGVPRNIHRRLPGNIVAVERTESISRLAEWYSAASVVMSLSRGETFGLTLAEGLACGTPSVVYDNTALTEIVHPETGIAVAVGDIAGLLDAVRRIINNPDIYSSDNCRRIAVERYDKDRQFGKYIDLYQQLL